MVIGNGMMAQAFIAYKSHPRIIIFASGVANSSEISEKEYEREKVLLQDTINANMTKHLVYFSSTSLYDPEQQERPYVLHKKMMERMIESSGIDFTIFRLPQVVGKEGNAAQLIPYFIHQIVNNQQLTLWVNAIRYLIDVSDVKILCNAMLSSPSALNKIINIAPAEGISVLEIVQVIERFLGICAHYTCIEKGESYDINVSDIAEELQNLNMIPQAVYLEKILTKYFIQYKEQLHAR